MFCAGVDFGVEVKSYAKCPQCGLSCTPVTVYFGQRILDCEKFGTDEVVELCAVVGGRYDSRCRCVFVYIRTFTEKVEYEIIAQRAHETSFGCVCTYFGLFVGIESSDGGIAAVAKELVAEGY